MQRERGTAGLPKLSRLKALAPRSAVRGPRAREVVRRVMQANRSTGTRPELAVQLILSSAGIRFARHVADVTGKPDFVIAGSKVAIFVDGDFWHGYRLGRWKNQLSGYWVAKIQRNRDRDRRTFATLRRRGWRVIRIWEHQLTDSDEVLRRVRLSMVASARPMVAAHDTCRKANV